MFLFIRNTALQLVYIDNSRHTVNAICVLHTHTHTYTHLHTLTHIHLHTHTYTHTLTHIHLHTYTYTHTLTRSHTNRCFYELQIDFLHQKLGKQGIRSMLQKS